MLRPRIIPCLLVHNKGLCKTTNFSNHKYIGDPLNAVRIFNEKNVDEIIILDIDKTIQNEEPDYQLISDMARECRMPLCYGGGIKSPEQVERIISLGVEKVSLSSAAIENPGLIQECANRVGSQSIVITIDIKLTGLLKKKYQVFTMNGKNLINKDFMTIVNHTISSGAGEIVINSIDREGTGKGYDKDLVNIIYPRLSIPLTVLGGASSSDDIRELIHDFGIIGAAAGSMFVLKGKYRAVLLQYPDYDEKQQLINN
tara:strand:+ start:1280 stop:2050 length:771 start_codon:yes stop_codon:yes gene_type:complete